jgi:hypothetical protein
MEQAVEAARAIQHEADREAAGEEPNVELLRALETAVAVCYWRPFTQSSIGRLDPVADGPSEESGLGELHRRLRRMRDKVYAHTDEEAGRDVTVRDLGPGTSFITEGWEPLPRDWLPSVIALAEGQADRFRAEALDLGDQPRELGPEDPDEVAQHAAEHKAAGLHRLGWEVGAGATVWARSIQVELARHEAARGDHAANTSDLATWERMHGSSLLLVVAIDQVLAFERRVRKLTGDAELQKARERFDYDGPNAQDLRDLVTHLDSCAVGEGWRQTGRKMPPLDDRHLETFLYWANGGGTNLSLGDKWIDLRRAATAAVEIARVVERARAKHLERVEQEANAAARRRFGLPEE